MQKSFGCIAAITIIIIGLALGFGTAALLTWLISLLGLIQFSWINSFIVWCIIIILGLFVRGGSST